MPDQDDTIPPVMTDTASTSPMETSDTVQVHVSSILSDVDNANNLSNKPIEPDKLDLDQNVLDRLTRKPVEKYRFRKSIGRGGMKMVLQVCDTDSMRDVAMAILPDAATRPKDDIVRFVQEARLTASLEHPNIVPVHDIGVDVSGAPYFTMKLLRGMTLATLIAKLSTGTPELNAAYDQTHLLRIFLKICHGVAFAHAKGVIHLDLKPENIQIGDFGEVLIMDWGLARILIGDGTSLEPGERPPDSGSGATRTFGTKTSSSYVTMDGVTKGTPGYMAPEQASGNNHLKNTRTDIYALGSILYAMVTLHDPIETKSIHEMIRDTVNGNIVPPHERAPGREIPSAIEAVILKAMSQNPEDRYESVRELRAEVNSFLNGYATIAEKASFAKKTILLMKRHKIIVSLCFLSLCLLGLLGYFAIHEHARTAAPWVELPLRGSSDDPRKPVKMQPIKSSYWNARCTEEVPAWGKTSEGIAMVRGEWLWLEVPPGTQFRVDLKLSLSHDSDSVEVAFASSFGPLDKDTDAPPGFLFQFGESQGLRDRVLKRHKDGKTEQIDSYLSSFPSKNGASARLRIQREEERFFFQYGLTGKQNVSYDSTRLPGDDTAYIGLRCTAGTILVTSLSIQARSLPEKNTPMIAADALANEHLYKKALERYLSIAETYPHADFHDQALSKAYHIASLCLPDSPERNAALLAVKKRIASTSRFPYAARIMKIDAIALWMRGQYEPAVELLQKISADQPGSDFVLHLLRVPREHDVPQDVLAVILQQIAAIPNLDRLDISGLGITSLEPLRKLKLSYLDCSDNRLVSLEGLEDMPLEFLRCSQNRISSLEPLRNAKKLNALFCPNNSIQDFEPIQALPLKRFCGVRNPTDPKKSFPDVPEGTGLRCDEEDLP